MNEAPPKPLSNEIAFVVLSVSDMARSREFYTRILGLAETANWSDRWVEYDIGGGTLAVTLASDEMPVGATGLLIALEVPDLSRAVRDLEARGGSIAGEAWDSPACLGQPIKDPDGYTLLLHQLKAKPSI